MERDHNGDLTAMHPVLPCAEFQLKRFNYACSQYVDAIDRRQLAILHAVEGVPRPTDGAVLEDVPNETFSGLLVQRLV